MRPHVLHADEPTGNLDSRSGAEIIRIIEELNREGLALIVVTHDPKVGERATREIKMADGRISADVLDPVTPA
jgi:putative ABC transport system ATP-binding protein